MRLKEYTCRGQVSGSNRQWKQGVGTRTHWLAEGAPKDSLASKIARLLFVSRESRYWVEYGEACQDRPRGRRASYPYLDHEAVIVSLVGFGRFNSNAVASANPQTHEPFILDRRSESHRGRTD